MASGSVTNSIKGFTLQYVVKKWLLVLNVYMYVNFIDFVKSKDSVLVIYNMTRCETGTCCTFVTSYDHLHN